MILGNLEFINIIVVLVQLCWFEKHLRSGGKTVFNGWWLRLI
jgi:hypothetical protein